MTLIKPEHMSHNDFVEQVTIPSMLEYYELATNSTFIKHWTRDNIGKALNLKSMVRLFNFLKNGIRYYKDEVYENILSPTQILLLERGDCEDYALFASSVWAILGGKSKWRVVSNSTDYEHVFALLELNGEFIAFDPIETKSVANEPEYKNYRDFEVY